VIGGDAEPSCAGLVKAWEGRSASVSRSSLCCSGSARVGLRRAGAVFRFGIGICHAYGCWSWIRFVPKTSGSMADDPPGCFACMHRRCSYPGPLHERWVLGAAVRSGLDARRRSRSGHLLQARTRLPICLYRYDFGARNSGAGEIKMRRIDYASRRVRSLISMYSWGYKCRETCMCAILTMTLLGGLSGGLHGMGVQPKLSIARSFVSLWRPRWNHPLTGWLQIFGS
jgi:hypothetical protein